MALTQVPIELSSTPGIVDNSNDTAITIDSSENVLVGTTDSAPGVGNTNTGGAFGSNGYGVFSRTGTAGQATAYFNKNTNDGEIIKFNKDGSTVGSIGTLLGNLTVGTGDTGVQFNQDVNALIPHNTTTGANVDNSIDLGYSDGGSTNLRFKDLYLSGGAYLGGTAAANKLDDYEEGTWTAVDQNGNAYTPHVQASYTKIGRIVYFNFDISATALTTGTFVYGLPFPSLASTVSGNWSVYTGYSTSDEDIIGHINASSSKISVYVGSTTHTINGRWMGAGSYYAA